MARAGFSGAKGTSVKDSKGNVQYGTGLNKAPITVAAPSAPSQSGGSASTPQQSPATASAPNSASALQGTVFDPNKPFGSSIQADKQKAAPSALQSIGIRESLNQSVQQRRNNNSQQYNASSNLKVVDNAAAQGTGPVYSRLILPPNVARTKERSVDVPVMRGDDGYYIESAEERKVPSLLDYVAKEKRYYGVEQYRLQKKNIPLSSLETEKDGVKQELQGKKFAVVNGERVLISVAGKEKYQEFVKKKSTPSPNLYGAETYTEQKTKPTLFQQVKGSVTNNPQYQYLKQDLFTSGRQVKGVFGEVLQNYKEIKQVAVTSGGNVAKRLEDIRIKYDKNYVPLNKQAVVRDGALRGAETSYQGVPASAMTAARLGLSKIPKVGGFFKPNVQTITPLNVQQRGELLTSAGITAAELYGGYKAYTYLPGKAQAAVDVYGIASGVKSVRSGEGATEKGLGVLSIAAGTYGLASKSVLPYVKGKLFKQEFVSEGTTKQEGFVKDPLVGSVRATSKGSYEGKIRTYYSIKVPTVKEIKFGQREYDVFSFAKFSGGKDSYAMKFGATLSPKSEPNVEYLGRGRGITSGEKGIDVFEYQRLGEVKGKGVYGRGARSYEVALKAPEDPQVFIPQSTVREGRTGTFFGEKGDYYIQSLTKSSYKEFPIKKGLSATDKLSVIQVDKVGGRTVKGLLQSKKTFPTQGSTKTRFNILENVRQSAEAEFQRKGTYTLTSDVGRYTATRTEPVFKTVYQNYGNEFGEVQLSKDIVIYKSKEQFYKVGAGFSNTQAESKVSKAVVDRFTKPFMTQKVRVNPQDVLFTGPSLVPAQTINVAPQLKASTSFAYQSGDAAKSFALTATRTESLATQRLPQSTFFSIPKQKELSVPNTVFSSSPRTELGSSPRLDLKPMIKPVLKPSLRNDIKPNLKSELRNELRPDIKSNLRSDLKPALKEELKAEIKPLLKLQLRPALRQQIKPTVKPLLQTPPPLPSLRYTPRERKMTPRPQKKSNYSSYAPTLIGQFFSPKITATKQLGKGLFNPLSIRPQVLGGRRR